jgi:hypothetical protein
VVAYDIVCGKNPDDAVAKPDSTAGSGINAVTPLA